MAIKLFGPSGYNQFKKKFNRLKHERDLFLFLLYDSGGEKQAISHYISKRFQYLDELANASHTFIFLFTPSEMGASRNRNPGPAVAAKFGMRVNQLPGVLVFCLADDGNSFGDGTFFPLNGTLFQDDPKAIDDAFADLFSMIQVVAKSETTAKNQINALQRKIKRQKRAEEMGPFTRSLKVGSISAINFAGQLLMAIAPAWFTPLTIK